MHIAIIGTGNVGSALAHAWVSHGHILHLGVRDPADAKVAALVAKLGVNAQAHTLAQAVAQSEIVVLCTPWGATKDAVASCGSLAGKTVIDCTNPLLPGLAGLEVGLTTSAAEQVAKWATGASTFKCFNQTGAENMAGQQGYPVQLVMFIAGDDAARKPEVMQLAREAGFDAVDAGPLTTARYLEPMAMLWIHLAYKMGQGRQFAFALVRR